MCPGRDTSGVLDLRGSWRASSPSAAVPACVKPNSACSPEEPPGPLGGALIGAIAGNAGLGAAIGGATGLAGGFLAGKHTEATSAAYQQGVADGMRQAQQPVSR
jgi:hypothetical protein